MCAAGALALWSATRKTKVNADEAATIADCRSILDAQHVYAMATGAGHAAPLACLADPSGCVPGYKGERLIDVSLTGPRRSGYFRTFHAGPLVPRAEAAKRGIAPVHLAGWAYSARPAPGVPGRHMCVDSTGVFCVSAQPLQIAGWHCPPAPSCMPPR